MSLVYALDRCTALRISKFSQDGAFAASPDVLAILGRWHAEFALEGSIECGLGLVADVGSHAEHRVLRRLQLPRRKLHAPARQIGQRRLTEQPVEPLGQHGPGSADPGRQLRDGPWMTRPAVQQRQRATHDRIPRTGQPSRMFRRQLFHVPAQRFDEDRLSHLRKKHAAPGTSGSRIVEQMANGILTNCPHRPHARSS